ncbi:hypothetical protein OSJ77_20115 [Phyllobacterium sp. 0TCS1.6C]|nr:MULTISPECIES: hypothetical protein [unclassified Phyllobacterium]MCX8282501.1 hypothetical protein [Phyllobacterium sp. 0TCS1.6C]MCX8292593.1 hypothetical protein [Phyllobacterium sp. 0TCS1.6A]
MDRTDHSLSRSFLTQFSMAKKKITRTNTIAPHATAVFGQALIKLETPNKVAMNIASSVSFRSIIPAFGLQIGNNIAPLCPLGAALLAFQALRVGFRLPHFGDGLPPASDGPVGCTYMFATLAASISANRATPGDILPSWLLISARLAASSSGLASSNGQSLRMNSAASSSVVMTRIFPGCRVNRVTS